MPQDILINHTLMNNLIHNMIHNVMSYAIPLQYSSELDEV